MIEVLRMPCFVLALVGWVGRCGISIGIYAVAEIAKYELQVFLNSVMIRYKATLKEY